MWKDPPHFVERLHYRVDGSGYVDGGSTHLFVVAATGGQSRQLTCAVGYVKANGTESSNDPPQ